MSSANARSSKAPAILAIGMAAAALGLSSCSSEPPVKSSADASPTFQGPHSDFCTGLVSANQYSAAAEQAKAGGDQAAVQLNAQAMYSALQGAVTMVPGSAPHDVKHALRKYAGTLERAITGDEIGAQAKHTVKRTSKTIKQYYAKKCKPA